MFWLVPMFRYCDNSYFKSHYRIFEKKKHCYQFSGFLKKVNLWPPIKHPNMITLYSPSHGLKNGSSLKCFWLWQELVRSFIWQVMQLSQLTRASSRKLGQYTILAKMGTFLEKRRVPKILLPPIQSLSKCFASKLSFAYFLQKRAASDYRMQKRSRSGPAC